MITASSENLTRSQKSNVKELIYRYWDIFPLEINTRDVHPIRQRPKRLSLAKGAKGEKAEKINKDMASEGVIEAAGHHLLS